MEDLSVIIPVKNESHSILQSLYDDLTSLGAQVLIIDDGSSDPFPLSIRHETNQGYGAAIMTGIEASDRPLLLTIDGDGQHSTAEVIRLYHAFKLIQHADMVIGVRRLKNEKLVRFLGRKFLNWTASLICTSFIPDLNSGARIFKRKIVTGYMPILCRTFSFTTSLTVSMMADKYRVEYFPIEVVDRKHGKSHVKVVKHGLITLYYILRIGFALRTRSLRRLWRGIIHRGLGRLERCTSHTGRISNS